MPEQWTCAFCGRPQISTAQNTTETNRTIDVGYTEKRTLGYKVKAARCLNPTCNEMTLTFSLHPTEYMHGSWYLQDTTTKSWRLLPSSFAKPQPDCVPVVLQSDYHEACAIRDLSPKASATLSRRCLQGMIRDFTGITKKMLVQEIEALRKAVDDGDENARHVSHESIDAIDAIREVGNIGAHMEADINHIVDVDPKYAFGVGRLALEQLGRVDRARVAR